MAIDAAVPGVAITGIVFCALLAAIHIYIFALETVLWKSRAAKTFGLSQTAVDYGASLAANQGFYNLLLAVGLIWSTAEQFPPAMLFFLAAVFTAGVFGVVTASFRILFVQVIPSFLGFIFVAFGYFPTQVWSSFRHPLYALIILLAAGFITFVIASILQKYFLTEGSKTSTKPTTANRST